MTKLNMEKNIARYIRQLWKPGDLISSTKLNNIENGIVENQNGIANTYRKDETYNKTEMDATVTEINQQYQQIDGDFKNHIQNHPTAEGLVIRDVLPNEIFELDTNIPTVNVTSVTLNKTTTTIPKGSTETLIATVSPPNATNKSVTWTSSNTSIATVNNGVVTGVANGNTVITVTTVDGSFTATCNVTVKTVTIPVTSVSLDKTTHTFKVDETVQLNATVLPSNANNKNVTWSSSDETKATVVDGLVTAKAEGSCVITVTTVDGSKTAICNLTINAKAVESGYVTENLDIMYDLTKYEDGYLGDVLDEINNVKAIVTGQESYTTGRNGFVGGKFMINKHITTNSSFKIPTRESYNTYPFSIEILIGIRAEYDIYVTNGTLTLPDNYTSHMFINTRVFNDNENGGKGYHMGLTSSASEIYARGTLNSPYIQVSSDGKIIPAVSSTPTVNYYHFVFCLNSNAQNIYLNGELLKSSSSNAIALVEKCEMVIGHGDIKLIRIYNSYLSNSDVLKNYNDSISARGGFIND